MNWRELRRKANLSQSELAASARVSQSLIAKLERNQLDPSFARAQRILTVLQSHSVPDSNWIQSVMSAPPAILWETQSIASALVQLEQHSVMFSPVQNERGVIVGLFHFQPLLDDAYFSPNVGQKKVVSDYMISPQLLLPSASRQEVLSVLRARGVVLVGSEKELLGWILPYSVLKFSIL